MALSKHMIDILESEHKITNYRSWYLKDGKWVEFIKPVAPSTRNKPKNDYTEDGEDIKWY